MAPATRISRDVTFDEPFSMIDMRKEGAMTELDPGSRRLEVEHDDVKQSSSDVSEQQ